jgi:hypothetical protein
MPVKLSSTGRAIVAGVAAAALLMGAFLLGLSQATVPTAAAAAAATTSQASLTAVATGGARITVTGTGTVTGTPDQLLLSMGVQTSGASVSSALASANRAVRAVTGALRHDGVAAADIQTSGLSIQPNYRSSGAPSGYGVSESVSVTLRNLASAGNQISVAARAGGNATVVDGVSLNFGDSTTLLAAARGRAVADAKAKASAYARAIGHPLGPAVGVSEAASPAPEPFFGAEGAAAAPRPAAVPVHPGSQKLTVTVTVVYTLG